MKIIKLDAIDSTNSYIKRLTKDAEVNSPLIVVAKNQTNGRGQHSTNWITEPNKNLTFSTLIELDVDFTQQKFISFCTALAVVKFLEMQHFTDVKIKWPNDIMAGGKKICGILIENLVRNNAIYASVVGIGLNVNQTKFDSSIQNATSMKLIKNDEFDLDACMYSILEELFFYIKLFENKNFEKLEVLYHQYLYKKDKIISYIDTNKNILKGVIKKVGKNGELLIENEFGILLKYQVKEIQFL